MGKASTDLKLTKKRIKEIHETEKFELEDGSTITFYPIFPHTKIREMFDEFKNVISTKPEEVIFTDQMSVDYLNFLMIKHFTHLKSQLKAVTFVEQLNELNSLIDFQVDDGRSIFSLILNDIFLPKEKEKISQFAAEHIAQYEYLGRLDQQVKQKVDQLDLKNREILETVFTKNNEKHQNQVQ
ncbi:hypothetical protein [Niallia taxi]|uniref:hypothetical protein n=1 Tax=Niallia taxi TaxID=2499688 RepID=UPI0030097586